MTLEVNEVRALPRVPAVYVMYGGSPRWAAYVGISVDLRERVTQHLIKRDSSVVTSVSAVGLNPQHVRELEWWERDDFDERERLEAAELVAFSHFDPALRSRGRVRDTAGALAQDVEFVAEMNKVFESAPTGRLVLPSLEGVARRLEGVERRLADLERASGHEPGSP